MFAKNVVYCLCKVCFQCCKGTLHLLVSLYEFTLPYSFQDLKKEYGYDGKSALLTRKGINSFRNILINQHLVAESATRESFGPAIFAKNTYAYEKGLRSLILI